MWNKRKVGEQSNRISRPNGLSADFSCESMKID